jgi:hypothetical protein
MPDGVRFWRGAVTGTLAPEEEVLGGGGGFLGGYKGMWDSSSVPLNMGFSQYWMCHPPSFGEP